MYHSFQMQPPYRKPADNFPETEMKKKLRTPKQKMKAK